MARPRPSPALVVALLLSLAGRPAAAAPSSPQARQALLERFAPVVLLAPGERALPASVPWFLAHARLEPAAAPGAAVTLATLGAPSLGSAGARPPRLRLGREGRGGSADGRDWVVYGHVYRGADGGARVQYWFFYPFNDMRWAFDHEGDWEHVTVRLDAAGQPLGAWYARHQDGAPGRWFPWSALAREGDHPVVLSAHGSHASYADRGDAAWFDAVCPAREPARAPAAGCRVWRTWAAPAAVRDLGRRGAPAEGADFLAWPGRWGATVGFGREGGGPPGPAFQRGWCATGAPDCD